MGQRESKLSSKILTELRKKGAFCNKNHGSEYTMAGLPDISGCYRGYYFAFETKMPEKRNNTSDQQDRVMQLIRQGGGMARVVCSPQEAIKYLEEFDGLPHRWALPNGEFDRPDDARLPGDSLA